MTSANAASAYSPTWRKRVVFAYLQEPPFCFRAHDGSVSGSDVELARAILVRVGVQHVEPIEAEFAELLPGLVDGQWTMTTGLFVTEERRKRVDFSRPIWALHDGLLVRAGNPRGITGYSSIATDAVSKIGVIKDQAQHDSALRLGVPADRIIQFGTQNEAARAVADGLTDSYASVAMAHRGYLKRNHSALLTVIDVPVSERAPAFGAFAFAKSNNGLIDAVNRALEQYLGSSAHIEMMERYGFSKTEVSRVDPSPGSSY